MTHQVHWKRFLSVFTRCLVGCDKHYPLRAWTVRDGEDTLWTEPTKHFFVELKSLYHQLIFVQRMELE